MKWLKIFAWIVFPYIMILFAWKRFGVVKRTTGVIWAFFILLVTVVPKDAPSETVAASRTPETAVVETKTVEPKAFAPSAPAAETKANAPAKKTTQPAVAAPAVTSTPAIETSEKYDQVLHFPADKYPQTAAHIAAAFKAGKSQICTIDRNGADANRDASLTGLATKNGYDRDEWPMAMCAEGGAGADIAYVDSSENRGSGSWVGSRLRKYDDGTRVLFVLDGQSDAKVVAAKKEVPASTKPEKETVKTEKPAAKLPPKTESPAKTPAAEPAPAKKPEPAPVVKSTSKPTTEVYFKNCTAVREAGADPIYEGDPGYSRKLDRDGDGVGCE